MSINEILAHLQKVFPSALIELHQVSPEPAIGVPRDLIEPVARVLRDDPDLHFECLMCLSGVDLPQEFRVQYHLYSMRHGHRCAVRCSVGKEDPVLHSVSSVWPAAEWHEREAFDMLGIRFEGHPDLRRILCPDDWEGHPLRKDYQPPTAYHGISLTADLPSDSTR